MRPTIVEPANVSGDGLAELKAWLGISRASEDGLLTALLQASLDMCDAFTRQAPLAQVVEEKTPVLGGWYGLNARPAKSLVSCELVGEDGLRTPLATDQFTLEIDAAGRAALRVHTDQDGQSIAVRLRIGIADTWGTLPAALRQGIVRLSVFQYRERDRGAGGKSQATPPASVLALWRPWRTARLR